LDVEIYLQPPVKSGSVVDVHDKGRGYEIGKGQFLLIEEEVLEAIEIESTHWGCAEKLLMTAPAAR
jgi:non-homologous end joining protein Ku